MAGKKLELVNKIEKQIPAGTLMAIGGNENKGFDPLPGTYQQNLETYHQLSILKQFLELLGKPEPVIEVISTASLEPELAFADYRKAFMKLGINTLGHIYDLTRAGAIKNRFTDRLLKADGVIFTGGDQLRLTSIYGGTTFLSTLWQRYFNDPDFVIAGTSAGAMAFSAPMVYQASLDSMILKGEVQITIGFGLVPWATIDTHFLERRRLDRLIQVLATNPGFLGIGIEEDTAIIIRHGNEFEVTGNGVVILLDGHKSHCSNIADVANGHPVSIHDIVLNQYVKGEIYKVPDRFLFL